MRELDRMLFRMIKNSKGQFIAVIVIIIAGMTVFIAMNMVTVNLVTSVEDYYSGQNFADLFLSVENMPHQKIKELENIEGVKTAEGRIVIDGPIVTDDPNERVNARFITSKGADDLINICFLQEGRWHRQNGRETLVLDQFAAARGVRPGDRLRTQINGVSYTLDVAGVTSNPEFIYLMENEQAIMPDPKKFGVIYIPEALGRQMAGISGANDVLITYGDGADEEAIIKILEDHLRSYGLKQIIKREDQLSNSVIVMEYEQLGRMSSSLPYVFLAAAALVLVMMLGRMVKQERIKIGILKGLGYHNRDIMIHYTKYATMTGLLGGVFGGLLGMASAGGMTQLFLTFFHIPIMRAGFFPSVLVQAIVAACAFCIAAGLIGSRGVLKISPADSMKNEAPKMGKRTLLERIPAIWRRFTFSQKLVVKNVFRNKKRTAFVLMGVALTYAMMLWTTSMPSYMDKMMFDHYEDFQKMDYNVAFRAPVKASAVNDLRHIIDVEYMEGKLEYPFEFENGNKKQIVGVIGLQSDTEFYSLPDLQGNLLELPKSGVLISENLANNLALREGDIVKLNTFIPGRDDAYVEVRGVVEQTLGINGYMDIDYMGQTFMEKNAVNGVYFNSDDETLYEKLLPVANIASVLSMYDMIAVYDEYMVMMNASLAFMVIFSGILGFCIVYNATTIVIGEREMEFSALRVLGLGKNEIFRMIVNENNLIMVAGILVGIPLGLSLLTSSSAMFSTDLFVIKLEASPGAVLWAAVFTALFVFLAQLATYRKIIRLDLLSALKNRMN